MASNIINWIIDKYLNNILEINKDLTKSSILTGEIQMANLKIKPEIFTLLNLPFFELVHGYVGKLRIKVQMPRVHLHPIRVEVEKTTSRTIRFLPNVPQSSGMPYPPFLL